MRHNIMHENPLRNCTTRNPGQPLFYGPSRGTVNCGRRVPTVRHLRWAKLSAVPPYNVAYIRICFVTLCTNKSVNQPFFNASNTQTRTSSNRIDVRHRNSLLVIPFGRFLQCQGRASTLMCTRLLFDNGQVSINLFFTYFCLISQFELT